jgi:hypothetical protein
MPWNTGPTSRGILARHGVESAYVSVEEYFNTHLAEIESNPLTYAGFQKLMVRQGIAELPVPTFCELVAATWPR